MPLPETRNFIRTITKKIYFIPDRHDIERELTTHIEDSAIYIHETKGLPKDEAEKLALSRMGDAKEIGRALNRQHNPALGYLWYMSRIVVILLCIILSFQLIFTLAVNGWSIIFDHPIRNIPKDSYVRHVRPNELIKIDNRRVRITDVIQTEDGTLHVLYSTYNLSLSGFFGWNSSGLGDVMDEEGTKYYGGGYLGGSSYSRGWNRYENFPEDSKAIIEYDYANRYYRIEIDLGEQRGK
ncbi:MAG TPA: hypothetical protein VFC96_07935 [Anaerovoracaceae bacterium]|nr:hypothetical protein [Anaerovoracaceae bacterium]